MDIYTVVQVQPSTQVHFRHPYRTGAVRDRM